MGKSFKLAWSVSAFGLLAAQAAVAHPMAAFEFFQPGMFEIERVSIETLDAKTGEVLSRESHLLSDLQEREQDGPGRFRISTQAPWYPGDPVFGTNDEPTPQNDEPQTILDKIINYGSKFWQAVVANRPVVKVTYQTANALPEGTLNVRDLDEWQMPEVRRYRVIYQNLLGMNVVTYQFQLTYTPGGKLNGVGQFLSNINITSRELDVAWGYTMNATGTVPNVVNLGKKTSPLAAAEVQLNWVVETPLKRSERTETYFVRGDGAFKALQ